MSDEEGSLGPQSGPMALLGDISAVAPGIVSAVSPDRCAD